jgi:ribosomal protein S13
VQLEESLITLKGMGGEEARQITILQNRVELEGKIAALHAEQLQKLAGQADAQLQLQASYLNRQINQGDISTLDAQVQQNFIIQQRICLMQALQDKLNDERLAMLANRDFDVDAYNKIGDAINGITEKMESMRAQTKSLGAELQTTFVDSFGNHLSKLVNGTEKLRDSIKGFFNDLANSITKTIAKDWAENAAKFLNQQFGGKDGGFFDKVMSAITGKPLNAKDGSDPSKALWVKMVEASGDAVQVQGKTRQQILDESIAANTKSTDLNTEQIKALTDQIAERARAEAAAMRPKTGVDYSSDPLQRAIDAAKANGTLMGPVRASSGFRNAPFDYDTANSAIGRGNRPLGIPGFDPEFDRAARMAGLDKYGLNGDFLRFMALKESGMNPNAVSDHGATGLMQVMPGTAKDLGYTAEQMKDAANQIDAGAKYLAQMLERYHGDLDKALSAYNAGPGNTDAAIRKGLPYAMNDQTKDYVAVLGTKGVGGAPQVEVVQTPGSKLEVHDSSNTGAQGDSINALDRHTGTDYGSQVPYIGNPNLEAQARAMAASHAVAPAGLTSAPSSEARRWTPAWAP